MLLVASAVCSTIASSSPVAEGMSGIYEMKRPAGKPPIPSPLGSVGDIGERRTAP